MWTGPPQEPELRCRLIFEVVFYKILESSDAPLKTVAFECGFHSVTHMRTTFSRASQCHAEAIFTSMGRWMNRADGWYIDELLRIPIVNSNLTNKLVCCGETNGRAARTCLPASLEECAVHPLPTCRPFGITMTALTREGTTLSGSLTSRAFMFDRIFPRAADAPETSFVLDVN